MPRFQYVTKSPEGRTIKGKEHAISQHDMLTKLARRNLVIISITEVAESRLPHSFRFGQKKIKTFDLVILSRQLSTMLKGGIPLLRAIESISFESSNIVIKNTLSEMADYIREGDTFSESIKRFPEIFSKLFIAIVEAGERVGALDAMLERIGNYLAARDRINRKIITAITYPSFILVFFLIAIGVITFVLLPRFKSIYGTFGAKLPGLTLMVFQISDLFVKNTIPLVIVVAILIVIFHRFFIKTKRGRYLLDSFLLKIPVLGDLMKKAAVAKFARTFSTLIREGIPVTEAIELVGKTSGNSVIEDASSKAGAMILNGENIPEALRKTKAFPSLLLQMASVGVESGNLPELLDKTGDFYEEQVDMLIGVLTSLIEPILIVSFGIVLGVMIVALYLPIFKLGTAMSGGG